MAQELPWPRVVANVGNPLDGMMSQKCAMAAKYCSKWLQLCWILDFFEDEFHKENLQLRGWNLWVQDFYLCWPKKYIFCSDKKKHKCILAFGVIGTYYTQVCIILCYPFNILGYRESHCEIRVFINVQEHNTLTLASVHFNPNPQQDSHINGMKVLIVPLWD